MNYNQIAKILDEAALQAHPTSQISQFRKLNIEEAYAVQTILLSRRYLRGEKLTGLKLGFTSQAKMEQMGVKDMIWGRLTDEMEHDKGCNLSTEKFIHPRAEPEIAFLFRKRVDKILGPDDIEEYVEAVCLAVEIIDSRYENFKFSLEDVIADNCSSSAYVLGDWFPPSTSLTNIVMTLSIDNEITETGNSDAILGDPLRSLQAVSRLALEYGEIIDKGHIVLAGAATSAVFIEKNMVVTAHAEGLGTVTFLVG